MRESFAATIAFALLVLFMVFLAHLAGFAFAGGDRHGWGLLLTIAAAGASYCAQHDFTNAAAWLAHHQQANNPAYPGPSDPTAWEKYRQHKLRGEVFQLAAVALIVGAAGLFWLAM